MTIAYEAYAQEKYGMGDCFPDWVNEWAEESLSIDVETALGDEEKETIVVTPSIVAEYFARYYGSGGPITALCGVWGEPRYMDSLAEFCYEWFLDVCPKTMQAALDAVGIKELQCKE